VKPVSAFLLSTGRVAEGMLTLCAGEILKITLIERLFRLTRDRLMQIPAFAMFYRYWTRFHDWVTSFETWRRAREQMARLKLSVRRALASACPRRFDVRMRRGRTRDLGSGWVDFARCGTGCHHRAVAVSNIALLEAGLLAGRLDLKAQRAVLGSQGLADEECCQTKRKS
jgi:hypothetical protein